MGNNHLDKTFQYRLHDAEVPPPPFVWPSLERELKKRQRRKLAFWLLAVTLLTAVGAYTAWFAFSSSQQPKAVAQVEALPKSPENGQAQAAALSAPTPLARAKTSNDPFVSTEILAASDRTAKPATASAAEPQPFAQQQTAMAADIEAQAIDNHLLGLSAQAPEAPLYANRYPTGPLPSGRLPLSLRTSTDEGRSLPAAKNFKAAGHKKSNSPPKVCYDFARHPNAWMLDAYFGPSMARRTLSSTSDGNNYLRQRLSTERSSTAMGAGLRGSLLFNRNYLVRTGLHYDQFTEIFEYIDPTYVKYKIEVTVVNGQTKIDTVGVEYGENYLKTYNRYGLLDVPFLLGVEMRKGRTGVSINAGFSANLLFVNRGAMLDPATLEPARFGQEKSTLSQDVFRTGVGLSAMASVQWYWHLTRNLRVFAEPSFRQVLRPITLASHPVEQRYTIFGLRFGATHIF